MITNAFSPAQAQRPQLAPPPPQAFGMPIVRLTPKGTAQLQSIDQWDRLVPLGTIIQALPASSKVENVNDLSKLYFFTPRGSLERLQTLISEHLGINTTDQIVTPD
jgi:hypothetical protein